MSHPTRIGLGVACLAMGVIGAILPVIQGWVFFALAGAFFFPKHRWVHSGLGRAENHAPRFVAFMRRHGIGAAAAGLRTPCDISTAIEAFPSNPT